MTDPVDALLALRPDQLARVRAILLAHVPGREVWAFGSRATGKSSRHSDLDLAILGEGAVHPAALADLKEAFTESELPFPVDLIDWAATSDSFRGIIARVHVVLQPS